MLHCKYVIISILIDLSQTEFYHGSSAKSNGTIIYNLFSETRRDAHAREKRPISKHYSMTGVLPLEPHIDEMIQYLCQRLDENFVNGSGTTKVCELDDWTAFCEYLKKIYPVGSITKLKN